MMSDDEDRADNESREKFLKKIVEMRPALIEMIRNAQGNPQNNDDWYGRGEELIKDLNEIE